MDFKNWVRKLGFRRRYNPHTYLVDYYFRNQKLFSCFSSKHLLHLVESSNNQILNKLYAMQNILPSLHQETFGGYAGSFAGKDVVLLASGPTLSAYKQEKRISGAIHIGVNAVINFMELDYYFAGDWGISKCGTEVIRSSKAKKFFAISALSDEYGTTSFAIPLEFCQECNASLFFGMSYASHHIIQPDISKHPLFGYGTCIHPPLHFALYCRPRRIYLVGCDVSVEGHFNDQGKDKMPDMAQKRLWLEWKRMALFAKYHYPDVEIISINPVGLKGMFKDIYL